MFFTKFRNPAHFGYKYRPKCPHNIDGFCYGKNSAVISSDAILQSILNSLRMYTNSETIENTKKLIEDLLILRYDFNKENDDYDGLEMDAITEALIEKNRALKKELNTFIATLDSSHSQFPTFYETLIPCVMVFIHLVHPAINKEIYLREALEQLKHLATQNIPTAQLLLGLYYESQISPSWQIVAAYERIKVSADEIKRTIYKNRAENTTSGETLKRCISYYEQAAEHNILLAKMRLTAVYPNKPSRQIPTELAKKYPDFLSILKLHNFAELDYQNYPKEDYDFRRFYGAKQLNYAESVLTSPEFLSDEILCTPEEREKFRAMVESIRKNHAKIPLLDDDNCLNKEALNEYALKEYVMALDDLHINSCNIESNLPHRLTYSGRFFFTMRNLIPTQNISSYFSSDMNNK